MNVINKWFKASILVLFLFIIILSNGCEYSDKLTFLNTKQKYIFDKSVEFIYSKNWKIIDARNDIGLIVFKLRERVVPGISQTAPIQNTNTSEYGDQTNVASKFQLYGGPTIIEDLIYVEIKQIGKDVVVKIRTNNTESYWNPKVTFEEYKRFISSNMTN